MAKMNFDGFLELLKKNKFRMSELPKLYKNASLKHHPDKGGNEEDFKVLSHIYKLLEPIVRKQNDASVNVTWDEKHAIAKCLAESCKKTQVTILSAISEVSSSLANAIDVLANRIRAKIASRELHYDYASFSGTRFHAFTASTKNIKTVDSSLDGLKGDELKTAILVNFKKLLDSCVSFDALEATVKKFKECDEYKVLKQSQGVTSSIFRIETSSARAVNELIKSTNERIEREVQTAAPSV